MNEKIMSQMSGVFEKYRKNYSSHGVGANLSSWSRNKGWLVDLLRKHPNWDEDSLAVVYEVNQSREIDEWAINSQ